MYDREGGRGGGRWGEREAGREESRQAGMRGRMEQVEDAAYKGNVRQPCLGFTMILQKQPSSSTYKKSALHLSHPPSPLHASMQASKRACLHSLSISRRSLRANRSLHQRWKKKTKTMAAMAATATDTTMATMIGVEEEGGAATTVAGGGAARGETG